MNNQMQTNDKDIYAVGDAVETDDFITHSRTNVPLAGPANRMGRLILSTFDIFHEILNSFSR